MTKLQELTLFSKDAFMSNRYLKFLETPLGKLHKSIPFTSLANLLPKKTSNAGAPSTFSHEGFFGLMILKAYTNLSDEKLIDRINTDWAMQYFCGIQLLENQEIKDTGIPSRIRLFLGEHLDIEQFQSVFVDNWSGDMEHVHTMLNDATAYESYIKFPTDIKLLWDCCYWVFTTMYGLCRELGISRPRSRFSEQKVTQLTFQKRRRKTYKITRRRIKALLYLLNKGMEQLYAVREYASEKSIDLGTKELTRLFYIQEIYTQQQYMYDNKVNKVANRIVSLFKPYLRPIKRGKEKNSVEFGAKVTASQVDGINLIDKLSFDPYNEAKVLKDCITKHKQRFGECKQAGLDAIYGTNENRTFMKGEGIFHSLVRKGKPSHFEAQEKILRRELGKERSTVLEGSFGNEKNHYGLRKIKARTEAAEVVWIFFGIMCANAVRISKRRTKKAAKQKIENKQLKILYQ